MGARTQEEVLGKTDRDVFPPQWAEDFSRDDYQVVTTGDPLLGKVERTLSTDRTPMWGLSTKVALRDSNGAIIGLVGATIDISKEVETRQALIRSEAMQKALLEAIPDLIFRMDAKGVFLDYKPSKSMNTLVTPDELLGRSIRDVLPAYLANKHLFITETVLSTGQPYTYEYELPDDKEQMRSFEARMVANGDNEVIVIVRDVTEMKIAEEERLEKERLQTRLAKEREMGDLRQLFTSTLSHEFRTPLATIMTSVEMLENYGVRMPEENRQNRLRVIRGQVNHLVHMLNDILTIMQVQGSQLRFTPEIQDVRQLVETITTEFQNSIGLQHRLHVEAQPHLGLLPVDTRLFRYIYFNLLTNAIKYSDTGKNITTRLEREGNLLKLIVSDEGIGIPKADQARLFQAFQRGSNVSMISGSGLGLKIVKDCIDLHRGTIEIESEENVGTTVIVRLPTQYSRDKRFTTDEQTVLY
ncbi:MAG: ATP-binding protein [Chloroflexota bacterium]|nr:ATP-binding protein [Chloroflexota bacterium]